MLRFGWSCPGTPFVVTLPACDAARIGYLLVRSDVVAWKYRSDVDDGFGAI